MCFVIKQMDFSNCSDISSESDSSSFASSDLKPEFIVSSMYKQNVITPDQFYRQHNPHHSFYHPKKEKEFKEFKELTEGKKQDNPHSLRELPFSDSKQTATIEISRRDDPIYLRPPSSLNMLELGSVVCVSFLVGLTFCFVAGVLLYFFY